MNKSLFILLFCSLCFSQWVAQYPRSKGNLKYNSVLHRQNNGSEGFPWTIIVGDKGTILAKGHPYVNMNWELQVSPTIQNLNFIYSNSLAVGDSGTVIKSSDHGKTWVCQLTNTRNNLFSCKMTHDSIGFAVGENGTLLKTNNSGANWNLISSNSTKNLNSISFSSAKNGWIVGDSGTVLKTTDSGKTWNSASTYATDNLNAILFSYADGYIVGDKGLIVKTADSGHTWSYSRITNKNLRSVSIVSGSVFIAGDSGTVFYSSDGNTWNLQNTGVSENIHSVSCLGFGLGLDCYIVGDSSRILYQNNSVPWQLQPTTGTIKHLKDVTFTSPNIGWIVGCDGTILKTVDGGMNWIERGESFTPSACYDYTLTSIYFNSDSSGWLMSDRGGPLILHTKDGGINWDTSDYSQTYNNLMLSFVGKYIFAYNGDDIYKSFNEGQSWVSYWHNMSLAYLPKPEAFQFVDTINGFIGATNGLFFTNDGGRTWDRDSYGPLWGIVYLHFTDAGTGTCVNYHGGIVYTSDTMRTWTTIMPPTTGLNLQRVKYHPGYGYAAISGKDIYRLSGNSWELQISNSKDTLRAISILSESSCVAVGDHGTILRTTNSGYTFVDKSITKQSHSITKVRNYPNPFNPSTTIEYYLPKTSKVISDIYSPSGKLIRSLENETNCSGTHRINWDGKNNAGDRMNSGVYFCKIKSTDIVLTKKIELVW